MKNQINYLIEQYLTEVITKKQYEDFLDEFGINDKNYTKLYNDLFKGKDHIYLDYDLDLLLKDHRIYQKTQGCFYICCSCY